MIRIKWLIFYLLCGSFFKCEIHFNTIIVLAIINYTNKEVEEGKACENCGDLEANIIYPTRPWVGESKDICSDCFKKEVAELNAS